MKVMTAALLAATVVLPTAAVAQDAHPHPTLNAAAATIAADVTDGDAVRTALLAAIGTDRNKIKAVQADCALSQTGGRTPSTERCIADFARGEALARQAAARLATARGELDGTQGALEDCRNDLEGCRARVAELEAASEHAAGGKPWEGGSTDGVCGIIDISSEVHCARGFVAKCTNDPENPLLYHGECVPEAWASELLKSKTDTDGRTGTVVWSPKLEPGLLSVGAVDPPLPPLPPPPPPPEESFCDSIGGWGTCVAVGVLTGAAVVAVSVAAASDNVRLEPFGF